MLLRVALPISPPCSHTTWVNFDTFYSFPPLWNVCRKMLVDSEHWCGAPCAQTPFLSSDRVHRDRRYAVRHCLLISSHWTGPLRPIPSFSHFAVACPAANKQKIGAITLHVSSMSFRTASAPNRQTSYAPRQLSHIFKPSRNFQPTA